VRVLMIGPGAGIWGGIAALNEAVVPVLARRVDLLYLPTVENRPLSESGRISARNVAVALSQYARFLRAVVRFRPRIIHLHTSRDIAWLKDTFFVLAGRVCRCRVVLHMHGGNFLEIYDGSTRLMRGYTRWVLTLTDKVIELSEERAKRLTRVIPGEHVVVLRNCVDTSAFAPRQPGQFSNPERPLQRSSPQGQRGTRVLFLGVVGPSKGTFDLLEAAARLRPNGTSSSEESSPLELWVAGPEERAGDLARVCARAQELGLADMCHLPGVVRGASKTQLLQGSDLFTLPSYHEGLPMAILEAMATGLPVVATHVGGIPELVQDGYNGYLIRPGDVEALAEKLNLLARDPKLREIMGQRNREIAERELDVGQYVERLVALYESLIAGQGLAHEEPSIRQAGQPSCPRGPHDAG
jgi:glycosyltransferase involved in cell wall biosynthesis